MYDYIIGKLVQKEPSRAIVETNGIGYDIKIPLTTYSALGETGTQVQLFTHLHIREDAHLLYGFAQRSDRDIFLMLLSVSGVGAATALAILSAMKGSEVSQHLAMGNEQAFLAIKGVGTKTTQRLILELKEKAKKLEVTDGYVSTSTATVAYNSDYELALEALLQMGFNKTNAEKSIQGIAKKFGKTLSVEEIIKIALKNR
ncbi:MAG: Holliday junction branch migration protein RuvA [Flammeovirgaceae bacterium]|nr:Holliday junction branch migration protein RuvA [Flammeovirgaceae bacterium]